MTTFVFNLLRERSRACSSAFADSLAVKHEIHCPNLTSLVTINRHAISLPGSFLNALSIAALVFASLLFGNTLSWFPFPSLGSICAVCACARIFHCKIFFPDAIEETTVPRSVLVDNALYGGRTSSHSAGGSRAPA